MPSNGKEPDRYQRMAAAAAAGDVDGVLRVLKESPVPAADAADGMQYVKQALEVVGNEDPAKLIRVLFTRMLVFEGGLLFRLQHHVDCAMTWSDERYGGASEPPAELAETWLPRLSRLH